ncbi:HEAT repeat domain-containing protein [Cyanobacterium stanieri LEGE 03274]|uniref:HEAT repeat domain-containing protein n=1 Tax=Cyanobacterium stanieri LEGE 03274 TaxID=1828756 RepID=A0ABR9V481_9CHRO|nr:HEAT repeat domain-containing protein [Cyanobacterium stanieri]MBE9222652.1 HEAT repeat domain-containing protein [Cyanobacterium stanieri LEGE 03274]
MLPKKWLWRLIFSLSFYFIYPTVQVNNYYQFRAIASEAENQDPAILYDENMRKGYQATDNRQYDEALSYFQTALTYRPNDVYAQRAINNVEAMSANNSNRWDMDNLLFLLIISLVILVIIISITLIIVGLKILSNSQKKTKTISDRPLEQISLNNNILEDNQEDNNQLNKATLAKRINPEVEKPLDKTQELIKELIEGDAKNRSKVIWNLASQADSRAIAPLLDIMIKSNSQEKTLILEAISQIAFNSIKPINQALILSLQDDHGTVRKNALRDVSKVYELITQVQPIITQTAYNDPDPEVREIALSILEKIAHNPNLFTLDNHKDYAQEIDATLIQDNPTLDSH